MNTLALRRRAGEAFVLAYPGGAIEVTVVGVDGLTGQATITVLSPGPVKITRSELLNRKSVGDRN